MSILLSSTLANEATPYYALAGAPAPAPVNEIITGMILMYNGGVSAPTGWAFCDGTNGTPDLRDRFVIQASGTHLFGSTGGSATATLVVNNLPDHQHGGVLERSSGVTAGSGGGFAVTGTDQTTGGISSVGYVTPGGTPFSVENPYYVLAFIMKL